MKCSGSVPRRSLWESFPLLPLIRRCYLQTLAPKANTYFPFTGLDVDRLCQMLVSSCTSRVRGSIPVVMTTAAGTSLARETTRVSETLQRQPRLPSRFQVSAGGEFMKSLCGCWRGRLSIFKSLDAKSDGFVTVVFKGWYCHPAVRSVRGRQPYGLRCVGFMMSGRQGTPTPVADTFRWRELLIDPGRLLPLLPDGGSFFSPAGPTRLWTAQASRGATR